VEALKKGKNMIGYDWIDGSKAFTFSRGSSAVDQQRKHKLFSKQFKMLLVNSNIAAPVL
jgi:hypothetical protein